MLYVLLGIVAVQSLGIIYFCVVQQVTHRNSTDAVRFALLQHLSQLENKLMSRAFIEYADGTTLLRPTAEPTEQAPSERFTPVGGSG